jgi:rod shape-determining protein MreD
VKQGQSTLLALSLLAALLLGLMPFPELLIPFKPFWLALVLCYWLLEQPERVGLGFAFGAGLLADVLHGSLLGEHALRLCMMAFIILRFRPRLRFFTLWQQALAVFAVLLNDRVVLLMIRGFSGEGLPPLGFWLSPVSGLLLWPWLFLALDGARLRMRQRSG